MSVIIGFAGDFCPWERMEKAFRDNTWQQALAEVEQLFRQNDLNIVDLECPLIEHGNPILKTGPHIKALPETVEILKHLHVEIVATANNHFMDYGDEGLKSTYAALSTSQIDWIGSGHNLTEASRIHYREIQGMRIAFLNLAENEWSTTQGPEAGVNPLDPVSAFHHIKEAQLHADKVLVIVHGGHEHYHLPSPRMKKLYRFFVECGAHAVISHHTHIVSGYEVYREAPIFYSLGNFCFDWPGMRHKPWNEGMIVCLRLFDDRPSDFEIYFTRQNDEEAGIQLLIGEERDRKEEEIRRLNQIIAVDSALEKHFEQYCASQKELLLAWMEPYRGRYLPSLRKRKWIPSLLSPSKKRLITNLIRCESHRDVLLRAFNSE